jgi:hypothetical protein
MGCLILYTETHLIAFYFDNSLFISFGTYSQSDKGNMELKTELCLAVLMNVKPFQKTGEIYYADLNSLNRICLQFHLFKTLYKFTIYGFFLTFCHNFFFLFMIRYSYKILGGKSEGKKQLGAPTR